MNFLLLLIAISSTFLCGAPLVFGLTQKGRLFTKIVLSIAVGYSVIALAGMAANFLRIDLFLVQISFVLIGATVFLHLRDRVKGRFDDYDWIVVGIGLTYVLICLAFFDRIIIWMGGDAVAHASIIRMLLDGKVVPVSIPPLGSYWDYYPKGFHFYSYMWARLFPILDVIQVIPVLITAVTPSLLYSIVRELTKKEDAIYAFSLACLVFPAHYGYLIWAGYPSAAAEMLLVAVLLAVLVEVWILPILLLGILFTHARLLVIVFGVLLAWVFSMRLSRYHLYIMTGLVALIIAAYAAFSGRKPEFLIGIITSRQLASGYAAQWFPAFISLFGAAIALLRRDRLDRLALSWTIAVIFLVILADIGLLKFAANPDRLLILLYLPLSLIAASALSRMEGSDFKIRVAFMLILLISGAAGIGAVFYSYAGSWGIPQQDYDAIIWLGKQNYTDAISVNLDETGAWTYPLTGIEVVNSRLGSQIGPYDMYLRIINNPGGSDVIGDLHSLGYNRSLIYISSVSLLRPGYLPPFAEFNSSYPKVNLSFPEDKYYLIYNKGAYIFGFPKEAFSQMTASA